MLSTQIHLYRPTSCLHWGSGPFSHGLKGGSVAQTKRHCAMANNRSSVSILESKLQQHDPLLIGSTSQETRFDKTPTSDEAVPGFDIFLCKGQEEDGYTQEGEFDASFMHQKEFPPFEEVENEESQKDCRATENPLTASKDRDLINEPEVHLLEEVDQTVLSDRILVLSRNNKIKSAFEYFRSMELVGLCPTIHACNSLISSLVRNGRFEDCLKAFDFTRRKKITTGHTYSLMLTGHANAQGFHSAFEFFKASESEYDIEKDFDAVVYNTMISICGKFHEWIEIERIWRSMKVRGCAGSQVTYHLLVSSFVQCGQVELAFDAYNEMVQNGFEPSTGTMDAIISACAKEGNWDAALRVFQKMRIEGLHPNLVACNALINSLGKAGELKLAFQAYDVMILLGHKPDAYTFNALLSALNKANRHFDALQLFEKIEENKMCQLNVHLYNTVLVSCSKLGSWDRALQILYQMEARLSALTVSYNLVIRACESARKPKIALQVYEHMVYQKCKPDIFTYLSLIRCCIWGDLWEELEEILNAPTPNVSLYNAAVQGMCLRGKINLANKIYSKMRESGLQPDGKTRALMLQNLPKGAVLNR
ncbi:pentatricopeptide repeat-containing protein At3g29290 [Prosopis cineraria]|uniref:pentatricopeptide repeat-containing protein At3g29290 n=1 Tax=Prosopis cineraria TaxID=364024 RepID=UPI002410191F|nr:pentatricopeptide repeat-containing protein At3g29290 [Prosopis cineraria]XP_054787722.1 pentatricopeptide repeat-containing protein At3g29290 [Prosopis cineraria]